MPQPISEAARILGERIGIQRMKLACSHEEISHRAGMNVANFRQNRARAGQPEFPHYCAYRVSFGYRSCGSGCGNRCGVPSRSGGYVHRGRVRARASSAPAERRLSPSPPRLETHPPEVLFARPAKPAHDEHRASSEVMRRDHDVEALSRPRVDGAVAGIIPAPSRLRATPSRTSLLRLLRR